MAIVQTNYSQNWGGRLFMNTWSDIRLPDEKYNVGEIHEIVLNAKIIGKAEVMSIRKFRYVDIRDTLSYLITGKPAYYLAAMVCRFYNKGQKLSPEHTLLHIVYMWKERNVEIQQFLLQEWWQEQLNTKIY